MSEMPQRQGKSIHKLLLHALGHVIQCEAQ